MVELPNNINYHVKRWGSIRGHTRKRSYTCRKGGAYISLIDTSEALSDLL